MVLAAAAAGSGAVWYIKDQQLRAQKQDADRKITELTRELRLANTTPSPSATATVNAASAEAAQQVVKQFLLVVANPSLNSTPAQRKAGLQYLSPKLQQAINQQHAGDPFPLLGIPKAVPFEVSMPVTSGPGLFDAQVTFKNPESPQTISIGLQQQGAVWVINRIVSFTGE